MAKTIRFHRPGGPEVLVAEEVEVGRPGPGELRIAQRAIGVNYIDTYHRSGLYPLPLPAVCGSEAAGVVEEVGEGVTRFAPGDRVAYVSPPIGAYAEARLYPADRAIALPDDVSYETAAAVMLKGLTVRYLIKRTFPVAPGMTVLWQAAAGGVGLLACQWLRALGVRVIGTVGSDEKAALAKAHGADETVVYTREDVPSRVRALTGGAGVPVVYDGVGQSTFESSIDCLAPLGTMVSFGNASGPVPPISPMLLSQKGSLYLTRPTLNHYTATREALDESAEDLFDALRTGKVRAHVAERIPLADAAEAHRRLEARQTTGSVVLVP